MKKSEIEDILMNFSYKDEFRSNAENSFIIFYREYSKYLYKVVIEAKKKYTFLRNDIIDDIVNNTFLKIYENPLLFQIDESQSDLSTDTRLKAYLSTIAKNNLKDLLNTELKENHLKIIDDDEQIFDPPEIETEENISLSQMRIILDEVLNTFKERDKAILLTLYEFYEEGKNTPSETLDWLCEVHKTTRDNIKAIKSRCNKKIIDHFKSKLTNTKIISK